MTIRPGQSWGETVDVPDDLVEVIDDAALAVLVDVGDSRPVRLVGGDLLTTLGGPSSGAGLQRFPIDVLRVGTDGRALTAVAHVVAYERRWRGWRGPIVAVMNTDRRGPWDVAPRAHPNDGRVDVVEVAASMGLRARWEARRRLPTGTHVPHPDIRVSRARQCSWQFDRPLGLWVDGVDRGPTRSLLVTVEPDAATIHI